MTMQFQYEPAARYLFRLSPNNRPTALIVEYLIISLIIMIYCTHRHDFWKDFFYRRLIDKRLLIR